MKIITAENEQESLRLSFEWRGTGSSVVGWLAVRKAELPTGQDHPDRLVVRHARTEEHVVCGLSVTGYSPYLIGGAGAVVRVGVRYCEQPCAHVVVSCEAIPTS